VRLLLDEHLSPRLAAELSKAGHDVVTAAEAGLRQAADSGLFRQAVAERRAVVTANYRDFRPLHELHLSRGELHYGLILVPRRLSLGLAGLGRLAEAFARLLQDDPSDSALAGTEVWLDDLGR
jgi:hypothetical protein